MAGELFQVRFVSGFLGEECTPAAEVADVPGVGEADGFAEKAFYPGAVVEFQGADAEGMGLVKWPSCRRSNNRRGKNEFSLSTHLPSWLLLAERLSPPERVLAVRCDWWLRFSSYD